METTENKIKPEIKTIVGIVGSKGETWFTINPVNKNLEPEGDFMMMNPPYGEKTPPNLVEGSIIAFEYKQKISWCEKTNKWRTWRTMIGSFITVK